MEEPSRAEAAELLASACTGGRPVEPLVDLYPTLSLDDSYRIQLLQVQARVAAGARVIGHKVGLTSEAMQRQLGVDRPDFGHLLDDMVYPQSTPIPAGSFLQPRIEPEVALVLGRRLAGPGVTAQDALHAVDHVLPALEIIDSRIRDWRITLLDTVADNASSGGAVLGDDPVPVGAVDLTRSGCRLERNGEVVGTGVGAAVMGSPLNALAWLANTLGERGVALEAGHVVLPGSVTAAVPVRPGDSFAATFEGIGSVTAVFGEEGRK